MKPKPFSALNHFTVPVAIIFFPPRALCRSRMPGPIVAVFVVRSRSGTKRTPGTRPQAFKTCDAQQLRVRPYPRRGQYVVFSSPAAGKGFTTTPRTPHSGLTTSSSWPSHRASPMSVSYTHLRAHETDSYLVCRL